MATHWTHRNHTIEIVIHSETAKGFEVTWRVYAEGVNPRSGAGPIDMRRIGPYPTRTEAEQQAEKHGKESIDRTLGPDRRKS
jgi:hypothetical protein